MISGTLSIKKLAIFDFCETLVSFQSADQFIDFILQNRFSFRAHIFEITRKILFIFRFFDVLNRLFPGNLIHKQLKLYQIKGLEEEKLEFYAQKYFQDILVPSIIKNISNELKEKKRDGFRIIILSGGYTIYLKYFADYFGINVNDIIATDIKIDKNKICSGKIKGLDCTRDNKIIKLSNNIENIYDYNLLESYAYSDCRTDLPLLQFVGNGIVVHSKKQNWVDEYNLEQILWE